MLPALVPVLPPHQHHNPLTMLHVSLPAACQARLTLSAFPVAVDDSSAAGGASAALRALRGTQVASISTRSIMRTGKLAPAAALEGFGALTSLECSWKHLAGGLRHVCQLTALRRLVLDGARMTGSWRQLASLTGLQHFHLYLFHSDQINVRGIVEAVPGLVDLTRLELYGIEGASRWQHLAELKQLQHLVLVGGDGLQQAPEHLLALPRLQHGVPHS